MTSFPILGVAVDRLTLVEATERLLRWARSERSQPHHVVTVNPEALMAAQTDPRFGPLMAKAALRTADGMGIRWAGELLSQRRSRPPPLALLVATLKTLIQPGRLAPFPEVVTGTDLMARLLPRAAAERLSCFLLGSSAETLGELKRQLNRRYPELRLTTHSAGRVTDQGQPADRSVIRAVAAAKPHLLFTSFGSPKGQRFIARYQKKLNARVALEVGGAFRYLAGTVSRAPLPVRQRGFEWLWRLISQPWRWNRILTATLRFMRAVYQNAHP